MRAWYDGQSGATEFPSCGNNTSYIGNAVAANRATEFPRENCRRDRISGRQNFL